MIVPLVPLHMASHTLVLALVWCLWAVTWLYCLLHMIFFLLTCSWLCFTEHHRLGLGTYAFLASILWVSSLISLVWFATYQFVLFSLHLACLCAFVGYRSFFGTHPLFSIDYSCIVTLCYISCHGSHSWGFFIVDSLCNQIFFEVVPGVRVLVLNFCFKLNLFVQYLIFLIKIRALQYDVLILLLFIIIIISAMHVYYLVCYVFNFWTFTFVFS